MGDPIAATRQAQSRVPPSTKRPFVCLSYAQSLDGAIAAQPGQPSAISGSASLSMTHKLRAEHECLLIGIGTALADDPQLNVRLAEGQDPVPVILDSHLRLPPASRLLSTHRRAHIFCSDPIDQERATPLEEVGATLHPVQRSDYDMLDIEAVLQILASLDYRSVMVEGGASVITHFLHKQVVDWLVLTISPTLLGGLHAPRPELIHGSWSPVDLKIEGTAIFGEDIVIWGPPSRRPQ